MDRRLRTNSGILALFALLVLVQSAPESAEVRKLFTDSATELSDLEKKVNEAEWDYETDISSLTEAAALDTAAAATETSSRLANRAKAILTEEIIEKLPLPDRRKLEMLARMNAGSPENPHQRRRLQQVIAKMEAIYSTAEDKRGRPLDPELEELMQTSRSEKELREAWKGWHDAVGARIRPLFEEYVNLSNVGAHDTGYMDMGHVWRSGYDMSDEEFKKTISEAWTELESLYTDLHCYVRRKLGKVYGRHKVEDRHGRIYAHLLGNMWAQEWSPLYDLVAPFPGRKRLNVTQKLRHQDYNPRSMIETAEKFYMSLGFPALPKSFWSHSMIEKPKGRSVVCHPSAWDMDGGHDVRLKMCTSVSQEDFTTVHHELGHIYYYMAYASQSPVFRNGANDGFHEAIGDTIALSSFTDDYLARLGLIDEDTQQTQSARARHEEGINYLMSMALEKIAFLPFGYLVDLYRWDVFAGEVGSERYNEYWWTLRESVQGVTAPETRSDLRGDFDPAAKFHVAADVPYMRYFLASLYQFQFHEAMCQISGHQGPLHECDNFKSVTAGQALWDMLAQGASQPWQDTMELLTEQRNLSAKPMLDYFAPLREFLRESNAMSQCGWQGSSVAPQGAVSPQESSGGGFGHTLHILGGVLCVALVLAVILSKRRRQAYRPIDA
mmetsp:Transcript_5334/g.15935  ORF Transcript_5334/g.15935 Transcript_5334/m.15935 type:complete len:667 (-) Transcript_5334:187-2187(-)